MRLQHNTSLLLDGRTGWHTGFRDHVSISATGGIRLAASDDPRSPLGLLSPDGSIGGLTLPPGIAFDVMRMQPYILDADHCRIRRYDFRRRRFVRLPATGRNGAEPRQFHDPVAIAVAGRNLYVADLGNSRVQVFDTATLTLRYVWAIPANDLFAYGGSVWILDSAAGRVFRHRAGCDKVDLIIDRTASAGIWTRLAVDLERRIYLLNPRVPSLESFSSCGQALEVFRDAGDVRDRFQPPALRLDYKNRFDFRGDVFDREGRISRREPNELAGPPWFARRGEWVSEALDSRLPHCQWHRLIPEIQLPPGAEVRVYTFTSELRLTTDEVRAQAQWQPGYVAVGPLQEGGRNRPTVPEDALVQSLAAQFLWLRMELSGDGYESPGLTGLRIRYPRESYLQYLPHIYQGEEESRRFLERYLSIVQTEWDSIDGRLESMAALFDPKAVPAGPFLDYLAKWLALPLEGSWNDKQKRHLLKAASKLYLHGGTPRGVREFLRVFLEAMTEIYDAPDAAPFPEIVEGFRERTRLQLSSAGTGRLPFGAPLWSPAAVGRAQLDSSSRLGESRLVSTGDPQRDLFHEFASRFRVFIPSALVRTAEQQRMLRRAVDSVKPAQTAGEICLVEPRFRVGLQSTLGIDSILGDYPVARLACLHQSDLPVGRPPRQLLGYDMVLSTRENVRPFTLRAGLRVGMDTRLS